MAKKSELIAFRKRFDTASDMVSWISSQINDWFQAPQPVMALALKLFHKVNLEPINVMAHKLILDCIYLTFNGLGYRLTIRELVKKSDDIIGIKVRPEPHKWARPYMDVICDTLNCLPSDLPMRT